MRIAVRLAAVLLVSRAIRVVMLERRCIAGIVMAERHAHARRHRRDSLEGNRQRDEQHDQQAEGAQHCVGVYNSPLEILLLPAI
jgi:hypothetical protein